jgi:hypothetical protein
LVCEKTGIENLSRGYGTGPKMPVITSISNRNTSTLPETCVASSHQKWRKQRFSRRTVLVSKNETLDSESESDNFQPPKTWFHLSSKAAQRSQQLVLPSSVAFKSNSQPDCLEQFNPKVDPNLNKTARPILPTAKGKQRQIPHYSSRFSSLNRMYETLKESDFVGDPSISELQQWNNAWGSKLEVIKSPFIYPINLSTSHQLSLFQPSQAQFNKMSYLWLHKTDASGSLEIKSIISQYNKSQAVRQQQKDDHLQLISLHSTYPGHA